MKVFEIFTNGVMAGDFILIAENEEQAKQMVVDDLNQHQEKLGGTCRTSVEEQSWHITVHTQAGIIHSE